MKKTIWIIVALAFIGLLGTKAIIKIVHNTAVSQQGGEGRGQWGSAVTVVKTETVKTGTIAQTLDLVGSIAPESEVAIQPLISGRLLSFVIAEGDYVHAGSVVGEIDGETLRVQIQQAMANLAQIKANVQQAEINVSKLKIEKARYQELLAKKFVSQSAYDAIEASYQSALASLEGVRAQQASAEKNFDLLQIQMRHTRITAPSSGFIQKTYTTPGANVTTGTTLATIVPLQQVKLVFQLDQTQAASLQEGMTVTFYPDAVESQAFQGTIRTIAPTFDTQTRSLAFSALLNNPNRALLPGMFGKVGVTLGIKNDALLIPEDALVQEGGKGQGVFVVSRNNIAQFRPLKLGLNSKGQVEVVAGLTENEQIVVVGQNRLRDGQEVQRLEGNTRNGWGGKRSWDGKRGPNKERQKGDGNRNWRNGGHRGGDRP